MKITKKQLRKIINEAMGMADHPDQVDDAQYDRGYQDGLDGYPPADDATLDYDAGYDDGKRDADLPGGKIHEGRMKEMEMQLVDEIVDLLIERGAVRQDPQRGFDDDLYQDALDYVRDAIVPALSNLAARGAYDRK